MFLTSGVETDLVEVPAARLVTDVLVDDGRTQLVQTDRVVERFTEKKQKIVGNYSRSRLM
jgi:hypothetical protein